MGRKLYVGNLTFETTASELESLFGQFGTVQPAVTRKVAHPRSARTARCFLCPLVGAAHVTECLTEADGAAVDHGGRDGSERTAHGVGHRLVYETQSGGDIQQAVYTNTNTNDSMCSNLDPVTHPCTPNLLAVRPQ